MLQNLVTWICDDNCIFLSTCQHSRQYGGKGMPLFAILRDVYSISQASKDKNATKPINADFIMTKRWRKCHYYWFEDPGGYREKAVAFVDKQLCSFYLNL